MSILLDKLQTTSDSMDKTFARLSRLGIMFKQKENITTTGDGFSIDNDIEIKTIYEDAFCNITNCIWHKAHKLYPLHCHNDSFEYLTVTNGSFLVSFGSASRIVKKGECVSLPTSVQHSVMSLEDESSMLALCIPPEKAYSTCKG